MLKVFGCITSLLRCLLKSKCDYEWNFCRTNTRNWTCGSYNEQDLVMHVFYEEVEAVGFEKMNE